MSGQPARGDDARGTAHVRAQKGLPDGVYRNGSGFTAKVKPKKRTQVTLAAPGGGSMFDTAAAAGDAIEKYEKAGSPTTQSHPLVRKVYRY